MCLAIVPNQKPVITTEDIVVYKSLILEECGNLQSEFNPTYWELNVLKESELKISNSGQFFDAIAQKASYALNVEPDFVNKGLHFFTSKQRYLNAYREENCAERNDRVICKALIPKGSTVYYDTSGLGVSNQLIINKVLKLQVMKIIGKGKELIVDITKLASRLMSKEDFISKYGEDIFTIVMDNFVIDMLELLTDYNMNTKDPEFLKELDIIKNKYTLFCAAFA